MKLSTVHEYEHPKMDVLVVGDPHAHPDYDNKRFEWLGRFAADQGVSAVVCLGDFADMASLSTYDRKKLSFEGRRYKRDVGAAIRAQEAIDNAYNLAGGKPIAWYMCGGNHDEGRIGAMVNDNAEFQGLIAVEDLQYEQFGWIYTPYKETLIVNGVAYSHFFGSGVMGRPIGGERPALSLVNKLHMSAVVGHNHLYDTAQRTRPDGKRVLGLSAGCYVHPDMMMDPEGWSRNTAHLWWSGLVVLRGVQAGEYEVEQFGYERLSRMYK